MFTSHGGRYPKAWPELCRLAQRGDAARLSEAAAALLAAPPLRSAAGRAAGAAAAAGAPKDLLVDRRRGLPFPFPVSRDARSIVALSRFAYSLLSLLKLIRRASCTQSVHGSAATLCVHRGTSLGVRRRWCARPWKLEAETEKRRLSTSKVRRWNGALTSVFLRRRLAFVAARHKGKPRKIIRVLQRARRTRSASGC